MILTVDDLSSLSIENINHPCDLHLIFPGVTLSIPYDQKFTIVIDDHRFHCESRENLTQNECKEVHKNLIGIFHEWKMNVVQGVNIEYQHINDWITIY
jgi:hypothetical protein